MSSHSNYILVGLVFTVVLFFPEFVLANQTEAFQQAAGFEVARDPRGIAALLVNSVFTGLGITIILYLVWGGYLVMTGGGESGRIDRGKRVLWTSTVGAIMLLSSYGISRYVILLIENAANDQPDTVSTGSGFSVDIDTTENPRRPADPLFDPDLTGAENDLVDPDFYK